MKSKTLLQGSLSIERMCRLAQVSRAGFYRYLQGRAPVEESMTVRSAIQEIVLKHRRRYGYRRVTAELRDATCAGLGQRLLVGAECILH